MVLMFQPGEEGYDGAGRDAREGVLDASGADAGAAYALHVTSSGAADGRLRQPPRHRPCRRPTSCS